MAHLHDPLRPHSHDPNPAPPSADPDFRLFLPDGSTQTITPDDLRRLPQTTVPDCHIVSTGHGTSGPFAFTGVTLTAFVADCAQRDRRRPETGQMDRDNHDFQRRAAEARRRREQQIRVTIHPRPPSPPTLGGTVNDLPQNWGPRGVNGYKSGEVERYHETRE